MTCCRITDNVVASGGADCMVNVWQLDGSLIHALKGHEDRVRHIVKYDESSIISASQDKSIRIWNWREGT